MARFPRRTSRRCRRRRDRNGQARNLEGPALAAIVDFGRRVDAQPNSITDTDIEELRSLGHRDRDLLDVVGLVALNVLTGSFNRVAGLEPQDLAAPA